MGLLCVLLVSAWSTGATAPNAMIANGVAQSPVEKRKSVRAKFPVPVPLPPYGRCIYTKPDWDIRLYPPIPRGTEEYIKTYNNRTSSERVNNRILNDYPLHDMKIHIVKICLRIASELT